MAFQRRKIIRPSGIEWTQYNCNIYHGCYHDCRYCYARQMTARWREFWPGGIDWRDVHVVKNAVELAMRDIKIQRPGKIMFCSMTDPYQPIERDTRLARKVLEILLASPFHILILTKSPLVSRDYDLISGHQNVEVGFTVTSLEDIPYWEPYAPGNTKRIEALKKAHEIGIRTFVSIEPWIPNVTYPQSIIMKLRDFVGRFIIGSMQYHGVPRTFYAERLQKLIDWLEKNKINYYLKRELQKCMPNERSYATGTSPKSTCTSSTGRRRDGEKQVR